jgi:hypothetical protein
MRSYSSESEEFLQRMVQDMVALESAAEGEVYFLAPALDRT